MSRLQALCDKFLQAAKLEHTSDGQAEATLVVLRRDGGGCIMRPRGVLTPYTDTIMDLLRRFDGTGIIYVAEMWVAVYEAPKNHAEMSVLDMREPRTMPDRGEQIRVLAVTEEKRLLQKWSTITRTAVGTVFNDSEFSEPPPMRDGTGAFLLGLMEAK